MVDQAKKMVADIRNWHGVGPKMMERLSSLGIKSIADLLFHLPLRYEDRTQLSTFDQFKEGVSVLFCGQIERGYVQQGGRRQLLCDVVNASGSLQLRFFHFHDQQRRSLTRVGQRVLCFGQVRFFSGRWMMVHPNYQLLTDNQSIPLLSHYTAVYPTCSGLSQNRWQKLVSQALKCVNDFDCLPDLLPDSVLQAYGWSDLQSSLRAVHQPDKNIDLLSLQSSRHPAVRRLAFEELLAQRLAMSLRRSRHQDYAAMPLVLNENILNKFLQQLPFELTDAQARVVNDIFQDMSEPIPMLRLLQGDVGSGKTLVAAIAMLCAASCGVQAALMVPTELLAEQHAKRLQLLMAPMGFTVGCLLGKHSAKERRSCLQSLKNGELLLVVGTHTLFQKQVEFKRLVLTIIDEQHRFGVHQRLAFWKKSKSDSSIAHQLIMTATPIPRTLAMTAYADLDTSVIDQMPLGRKPVKTCVLDINRMEDVLERIRVYIKSGMQVYWVCTRIEAEDEGVGAAVDRYQYLSKMLPSCSVALIHGQMDGDNKAKVMQQFISAEVSVLVATTVIEVGVDVANANVIIIENAERLGLAQLHQLRGRVGRSDAQAHCLLMFHGPLGQVAHDRLQTMREHNDGFVIAQRDLALRGPGEVLGLRQSGEINLRLAHLLRDHDLLESVELVANELMADKDVRVDQLINRWLGQVIDCQQV